MSKRILVVEDDLLNRMFLCAVLEKAGLVVQAVTDGAQVLDKAREFVPDLITMDINLPNVSGLELIERLQADPKLCQIPILAVTAYVGKGEEARVRKAGANDFLTKPISIRPFLAAVGQLLSKDATLTRPRSGSERMERVLHVGVPRAGCPLWVQSRPSAGTSGKGGKGDCAVPNPRLGPSCLLRDYG